MTTSTKLETLPVNWQVGYRLFAKKIRRRNMLLILSLERKKNV
jgi:hypothetical protein